MHYAEDGNVFEAAERIGVGFEEVLDFSSNVSGAPLPDSVRQAIVDNLHMLACYPDPEARRLRTRAAARFGVAPDHVLVGNGSTEFIFAIPRRLRSRRTVVIAPCYHDYWRAIDAAAGEAEGVLAAEADEFVPDFSQIELRLSGVDMVFIGNPNNPTGIAVPAATLQVLAGRFPSTIFVVDETYAEFVPEAGGATLLGQPVPENVIVLRSLSPFYAVPGLRLGFMVAAPDLCNSVHRAREPWTLSTLAQVAGSELLADDGGYATLREQVIAERERLRDELSRLPGLRVFHSQANFLLAKITRPNLSATQLCDRMLQQRILIRNAAGFRGLNGRFVRMSVRTAADNDRLLTAIKTAMDESNWK